MTEPSANADPPANGPSPEQRMLRIFALAGGAIVAVGVIVILIMSLTTGIPGDTPTRPDQLTESLPPLAAACPPPTEEPPTGDVPPLLEGDRTIDAESGISYRAYGDPWLPWLDNWSAGDLQVAYTTGQYFVTETYSGGRYLASILSGKVEAAVNDGTQLDLKCVSEQVAADVRLNYYPSPNTIEGIRNEAATLGGLPAWLRVFRLSFDTPGLQAKDELVGVAVIDVGKAQAAVMYVSIPGTHNQYDTVVDEVMESIRPV